MMNNYINKFKKHFKWTFHNIVAHPLCEIVHLLGASQLSEKIHDSTIPQNLDFSDSLQTDIKSIMNPERDD